MARTGSRDRLDQPVTAGRRRLSGPTVDPETFGRLAEALARFLGTSRFIVIQTCVVIVWIIVNVAFIALRFDKYPFILLNLAFSTQAAYAAPLILLAQNRQDDRDRVNLLEDRQRSARNLEDTEFLARELADIRLALGEAVTRDFLRTELRDLLEEMAERAGTADANLPLQAAPKKKKKPRRPRDQRPEPGDTALSEPQRPESEEPHVAEAEVEMSTEQPPQS